MDTQNLITVVAFVATAISGLIAIIYHNLDKKITDNTVKIAINTDEIKDIKEKFVAKEDFNRQNDKVDAKLDKILDMLMALGNRSE